MRRLIALALRNRKLHNYLRRVYDQNIGSIKATSAVEATVPEASPIQARISPFREKRLNLLLPALSMEHVFGGISTALSFLKEATEGMSNVRIILTDQVSFSHQDNASFGEWKILELEDDDEAGQIIVAAGNRYGKTLSVGTNDYFIATAWWTAISAQSLQDQQQKHFDLESKNKYIYLIQDYEPGFYPWSSRYALAESTYHNTENFTAVFNTSILENFFFAEGYQFDSSFHFEPVLHRQLRPFLPALPTANREKKILVYGRPSVDRNAFPIIIMALREWVRTTAAKDWAFLSAGEAHMPIDLGNNCELVSLGKLSIEDYAHELLTAYAGISLMISPHPSYPPLEMAAFGIKVITNDYKSKKLSSLNSNIHTVRWASAVEVAQKLEQITAEFEKTNDKVSSSPFSGSEFFTRFCLDSDPFSLIMGKVVSSIGILPR